MNILVNALLLSEQQSGVQYSIENTLHEMQPLLHAGSSLKIILPQHYRGRLRHSGLQVHSPGFATTNRLKRVFWENCVLPVQLGRKGSSRFVYHSPGYVLPPFSPASSVVTIHDLIALDLPELCQNETAMYFKMLLPATIRRARRIIAVSETVKRDIVARFDTDPGKIDVIYHGVQPRFRVIRSEQLRSHVREKYRLPQKFVLFVGNLEPKKNLPRLLKAFHRLVKEGLDHDLVIAGRQGWKYENIYETVRSLGLGDRVRFTGYVAAEDLPVIYNLSSLFAFPSLYEGFGIPVIEAMACGVPVMCSNRGALPEISGNSAMLVNAEDEQQMAAAMHQLLTNQPLQQKLVEAGLKRAARFCWKNTAAQTLSTYEKAVC